MANLNFMVGANVAGATKVLDGFTGGVMGKLGGINKMFPKMSAGATKFGGASSAAFAVMKRAILATGIGALLIAIVSLIKYFKSTQEGADKLERVMAGFGAAVAVLTDRFSAVGKVIVDAFSNPKQAIADLWQAIKTNLINRVKGMIDMFGALGNVIYSALNFDWDSMKEGAADFGTAMVQVTTGLDEAQQSKVADTFKSITKEIKEETKAAMELAKIMHELRDAELNMITAKAEMRREVAQARLDAMDESKTQKERIDALKLVQDIEKKHTEELIKLQELKVKTMGEEIALGNSMHEEFVEHENAKAALIDLKTKSIMTQKRLEGEVEALTIEMEAENNKRRAAEKKALVELEKELAFEKANLSEEEFAKFKELQDLKIEAVKTATDEELALEAEASKSRVKDRKQEVKDKAALEKAAEKAKENLIKSGFSMAKGLAKEGTATAKAIAVAETIYNTQKAIIKTLADVPTPFNIPAAVGIGLQGAMAVQKILSTNPESASGGSTSTPSMPAAPRPVSGAFTLGGGIEPEPIKAFVVTDEMTDSQTQLSDIRRRATI